MKYKVGDEVKVVALEGFQDGRVKVGDIVTIIRTHSDNPHYTIKTKCGKIWWLSDDEVELYEGKKMTKYTTEKIDYTGCHPVIAEHLKRGESILCRVRDAYSTEWQHSFMVSGYRKYSAYHYSGWYIKGEGKKSYTFAEPIPTKRKVLMSAEKAVVKLIENGWKLSPDCTEIQKPGTGLILECLKKFEGMEQSSLELYPDYLFEEVED